MPPKKVLPLLEALDGRWECPTSLYFSDELRARVDREFSPFRWWPLTPEQRRAVAAQVDERNVISHEYWPLEAALLEHRESLERALIAAAQTTGLTRDANQRWVADEKAQIEEIERQLGAAAGASAQERRQDRRLAEFRAHGGKTPAWRNDRWAGVTDEAKRIGISRQALSADLQAALTRESKRAGK